MHCKSDHYHYDNVPRGYKGSESQKVKNGVAAELGGPELHGVASGGWGTPPNTVD